MKQFSTFIRRMRITAIKGWQVAVIAALSVSPVASAEEIEVTVTNHGDGTRLAGTLSTPATTPKCAILLATGSGPQNRDEEIMGLRPFKVLSDSLGRIRCVENG